MKAVRAVRALGPIDVKSVRRDPLLRWMVFFPLLMVLLLRWGVPALSGRLLAQFQFDLASYYPLLMSFLVLMMPMIAGIIIGFLLLDQRDDQTLTALQVTPLTLNGYLVYRLTLPLVLSFLTTLVMFPLAGLVGVAFVPLVSASLAAAPLAPMYALFLAAFAKNKVEGFALMKAAGVIIMPPAIAYFVPAGWQLAFGLIPTYWPAKLLWLAQDGQPYGIYLVAGLIYQGFLLALLLRRFNRVTGR